MAEDRSDRVCVIGAGSSGLTAARNLTAGGFQIDVLERAGDLGGTWNYHHPDSRMYRSVHTISSKRCTAFPDFPMPDEFPDYPHHSQILEYLRTYARQFDLDRVIEYQMPVERVEPIDDGRAWEVKLATGSIRRYGAVVIANGHNWSPRWPNYPGTFTGEAMHSAAYKTPEVLAGKRVLVVGGGNSGCDIAVEAAQNAARALHSTRRGYYYIPKYLLGRPADEMGDVLLRLHVPLFVRRFLTRTLLRLAVGPPERYGLPRPDHKLFETHPIVNTLLPYYLRHGDLEPRSDIARLEGRTVHFVDGWADEVDLIVYATGYNVVFPFLDAALLGGEPGRPRLYKHVFHPRYDNLFVIGMVQLDAGLFVVAHWQARAVAAFMTAVRSGAVAAERFRWRKREVGENLGGGIRYKDTSRHFLEVEHWSYRKGLEKLVKELS